MLEGKLVRLRAYAKDDVPNVLEYLNNFEVRRTLSPGHLTPYTLEYEQKWYESCGSDPSKKFTWAIETRDERKYIGGCGYNEVNWLHSVATVGIFLGRAHWGKGYGTDAFSVLLDYIFRHMNINRVMLNVHGSNQRAIRSYEKNGFIVEGQLRQHLFVDGQYQDQIVMGLLRSEWKERPRS